MVNLVEPIFSVIMPVYNVEKFLSIALDSLKNQTFSDFEVICINDGSPDNSLAILEEYTKTDTRFKIINQKNQGPGIARNNGLNNARGKYIVFLDPDDFLNTNSLTILHQVFTSQNPDIIQFNFNRCNEEDGSIIEERNFTKLLNKQFKYSLKDNDNFVWSQVSKDKLPTIWYAAWDKAYKREFIEQNHIRFAQTFIGEDNIFTIEAILKAKKIHYLNKALYGYLVRNSSLVHTPSMNHMAIFENFKLIENFLKENNLIENYQESYKDYCAFEIGDHYHLIPKDKQEYVYNYAKENLDKKRFKKFLNQINGNLSLLEKFISVLNQTIDGERYKVIRFCILKFKFKKKSK